MKIYFEPNEAIKFSSITIGTFDGVHLGHQLIIERTHEEGKRRGIPSGIITFDPTPYQFFHKEFPFLLTPLSEKLSLLQTLNIHFVRVWKFDESLATLSAVEFLLRIKEELAPKIIVVGYDFRFGKNREGDVRTLKAAKEKFGFELVVMEGIKKSGIPIRSTTIREKLLLGDMKIANLLLGRRYRIEGEVIKGEGRGKIIGFPTLNIELKEKDKLLPLDGVYAVYLRPEIKGVMNIGVRPTFEGDKRVIEVHLIDNEDTAKILAKEISIEIVKRIRPEKKFFSASELQKQIREDIAQAKRILAAP